MNTRNFQKVRRAQEISTELVCDFQQRLIMSWYGKKYAGEEIFQIDTSTAFGGRYKIKRRVITRLFAVPQKWRMLIETTQIKTKRSQRLTQWISQWNGSIHTNTVRDQGNLWRISVVQHRPVGADLCLYFLCADLARQR